MSRVSRLRKAVRDRTKRTRELAALLRKEERAGRWRQKRTEKLQKQAERAKRTPTKADDDAVGRFRASRTLLRRQRERVLPPLRRKVAASKAKLASWRRALSRASGTPGGKAVKAAGRMVGKVETGQNDGPWLRQMERDLLRAGAGLGWMIPGQPYCGFGCDWSWLAGVSVLLPDGVVYTPNICPWGGSTKGKVTFRRVSPEQAKPGALVVMNFGSGGAKHVALARGPMRGGVIKTREFNTSPGNSGSQANGGGCWDRSRTRWQILCVVNVGLS